MKGEKKKNALWIDIELIQYQSFPSCWWIPKLIDKIWSNHQLLSFFVLSHFYFNWNIKLQHCCSYLQEAGSLKWSLCSIDFKHIWTCHANSRCVRRFFICPYQSLHLQTLITYLCACRLYNGNTMGQQFGPKCCRGDRIGCGLSFDSEGGQLMVFFTKNGKEVSAETFPFIHVSS